MPVVINASIFVAACLVVGLGLFVTFEEVRQLQGRHVAAAAKDVAVVLAGVMMAAAAGGYWLSMAMP